jgi:hypothetical protein
VSSKELPLIITNWETNKFLKSLMNQPQDGLQTMFIWCIPFDACCWIVSFQDGKFVLFYDYLFTLQNFIHESPGVSSLLGSVCWKIISKLRFFALETTENPSSWGRSFHELQTSAISPTYWERTTSST